MPLMGTLSFIAPTTSIVLGAKDKIQQLQEVHEEIKTMVKIVGEQAKRNYDKDIQQQSHFTMATRYGCNMIIFLQWHLQKNWHLNS